VSTTEWSGTAAEWDAERDRRADAMLRTDGAWQSRVLDLAAYRALATATMPPRPVERPSVVTARGWSVEWDGTFFSFRQITTKNRAVHDRRAHVVAACVGATDDEYAKIAALRDGPAPRYESLNEWVRVDAAGVVQSCWSNEEMANKAVDQFGGTAHAIYRRVEGDK